MAMELSADVLRAATLARKLRASERHTDLAARAAALGFWTWDVNRDEIWASANARALFGVSPMKRLIFRVSGSGASRRSRSGAHGHRKSAKWDGEYQADYRVQLPDGRTRWIAAHGRTEFDASQQPELMSGALLDITQQRQSELELQQLRGQSDARRPGVGDGTTGGGDGT